MNRFQITRTGTYLTVQDWGRFHYQHLGVSPSGIMDQRIPEALAKVIPHHQNQFLEFAYVGNYYNKTLVEVDFLHGLAESFLTLSDLLKFCCHSNDRLFFMEV